MIIERRPAGETISASGQGPVESRTEVKVPLKSEEVPSNKTALRKRRSCSKEKTCC